MKMTGGKTALLIVALVGSCYYGYSKYRALTPSAAVNNGHTEEWGGPRRDRAAAKPEDNQRRQEFAKAIGLTPEQEAALKKLREQREAAGGDAPRGREGWTSFSQILTPEQRAKMSAMREARRDKGAKAAMSPGEFQKYKAKEAERRKNWQARGGGVR